MSFADGMWTISLFIRMVFLVQWNRDRNWTGLVFKQSPIESDIEFQLHFRDLFLKTLSTDHFPKFLSISQIVFLKTVFGSGKGNSGSA